MRIGRVVLFGGQLHIQIRERRAEVRATHIVVFPGDFALLPKINMVGGLGGTQRPARVSGGGLNENILENSGLLNLAVGYAVEGHATRHAEVIGPGQAFGLTAHADDGLLGHALNGQAEVAVFGFKRILGITFFETKKPLPGGFIHHFQPRSVVEVLLVEPDGTVLFQLDEFFEDNVHVTFHLR